MRKNYSKLKTKIFNASCFFEHRKTRKKLNTDGQNSADLAAERH